MTSVPDSASPTTPPHKRKVVRAVGPRLRRLLYVVLALLAVLFANSAYLATITAMEWVSSQTYQNYFYQLMFLGHLTLGLLLVVPFLVFALIHMANTRYRRNRRAVRVGYVLFAVALTLLVSGLLLFRVGGFELKHPTTRAAVYWLHVLSPLAAIWLYVLHRLAGPRIRWRYGVSYAGGVAAAVAAMAMLHSGDPRQWNVVGPRQGEQYFEPSLARTATGNFIDAGVLMMDDYCRECHADVHRAWEQSSHHLSSFNNPAYLASVRETRDVAFSRDGTVQASRWCAGCHDPVPFFSGAFDDPAFDDIRHPTAHAGITCTSCHAITHVNSPRGNADYTIEEPIHYPFATSDNRLLQWINHQLVKAKPEFHKKTFLKPLHGTAEFCSTCHKVSIPEAVNGYKEFLRGQNHYDTWLLSGVSGHGARSFYYPDRAHNDCNRCHMPPVASNDFGAKVLDDSGELKVHDHLFPGANTGVAWLKGCPDAVAAHSEFLQDSMRVDLFGIKRGGEVDAAVEGPLRPALPVLEPGESYLIESVVRTLTLGHPFTQGTADSNEIWLDVTVTSGDRVIGRSGAIDDSGAVDPWSHFINVFMLDEEGNRINRRNPQDIRVPLYDHQIPPGAADVVHYGLELPDDLDDHVTIELKLQYRKFDQEYMSIIAERLQPDDLPLRGHRPGEPYRNPLPIVTMASDRVTLPVRGVSRSLGDQPVPDIPLWERWNDYGIGLLLKGKAELRQAEQAFREVEGLGRYDGPLNLARVYQTEGRLDEAVEALSRAAAHDDPAAPPWTVSWLSGVLNAQQGHLEKAIENFEAVLETRIPERGFDFSRDYVVINELGEAQFQRAQQFRGTAAQERRAVWLRQAAATFGQTLAIDPENATAHYNLERCYRLLGDEELAERHGRLHLKYKGDDSIRGVVVGKARKKYPAADHAAEALVIYPLDRVADPSGGP